MANTSRQLVVRSATRPNTGTATRIPRGGDLQAGRWEFPEGHWTRIPSDRPQAVSTGNNKQGRHFSLGGPIPSLDPGKGRGTDVFASSNAPRYVVAFLFMAFSMRVISGFPYTAYQQKKLGVGEGLFKAVDQSNLIAFVFLLAILVTMAEIQVTSELAVAFAFIIFLAVLFSEKNLVFDFISVFARKQTNLAPKEKKT